MAIASVGTAGSGGSAASSATSTFSPSAQVDAGNLGVLIVASDNINTGASDGDNNEHVSVTDDSGGAHKWIKLGEWANNNSGAASGCTVSVWAVRPAANLTTSAVITITFSSAIADRAFSLWEFTIGREFGIACTRVVNATDGAVGYGSVTAPSGGTLASSSRLWLRGLAKEANSTTNVTPSTNFTAMTAARSQNNAAAILVRGEFRINASTSETSNPTQADTGDTAGVFVVLEEIPLGWGQVSKPDTTRSARLTTAAISAASRDYTQRTLTGTGEANGLWYPQVPNDVVRQRRLSAAAISASGLAAMDADPAIELQALSSAQYPPTTRRRSLPAECMPTLARGEALEQLVTTRGWDPTLPPNPTRVRRAVESRPSAVEFTPIAAVSTVDWLPSLQTPIRRVPDRATAPMLFYTGAVEQFAVTWGWLPTLTTPTTPRRGSVALSQVSATDLLPTTVDWLPSLMSPTVVRRAPIGTLPAYADRATVAAQTVDFVFDYPQPFRFPRRMTIAAQGTWFEDLNWDLAAMASARYQGGPLLRPRSYAHLAGGAYVERTLIPPTVDWVLTQPAERPVERPRTSVNRVWAQQHFGVQIYVPVMSWTGNTLFDPITRRVRAGVYGESLTAPVLPAAPALPDLSWQPRYADMVRRRQPGLDGGGVFTWTRQVGLGIANALWFPDYPDIVIPKPKRAHVYESGFADRDLVAVAPTLSWQPRYPDRTSRLVLPVSEMPSLSRAEALGQLPVTMSWMPTPATQPLRARTNATPTWAESLYVVEADVPVESWTGNTLFDPRVTRAPRRIANDVVFTTPPTPVPALSWLPWLPEPVRRRILQTGSNPSIFVVPGLEQGAVPAISWKPVYPDRTSRRSLHVSQMPYLAYGEVGDYPPDTFGHTARIVGVDVFVNASSGIDAIVLTVTGLDGIHTDLHAGLDDVR